MTRLGEWANGTPMKWNSMRHTEIIFIFNRIICLSNLSTISFPCAVFTSIFSSACYSHSIIALFSMVLNIMMDLVRRVCVHVAACVNDALHKKIKHLSIYFFPSYLFDYCKYIFELNRSFSALYTANKIGKCCDTRVVCMTQIYRKWSH